MNVGCYRALRELYQNRLALPQKEPCKDICLAEQTITHGFLFLEGAHHHQQDLFATIALGGMKFSNTYSLQILLVCLATAATLAVIVTGVTTFNVFAGRTHHRGATLIMPKYGRAEKKEWMLAIME